VRWLVVFSRLGHPSKKRQSLWREIFADIARNAILQHQVQLVLKKHPALQRKVLMELAKKSSPSKEADRDCRRLTIAQCSLRARNSTNRKEAARAMAYAIHQFSSSRAGF
jgi:hypothetical protein